METRCGVREKNDEDDERNEEGWMDGGPIATVLYPRARSTPCVSSRPLPSRYIYFRAYVHIHAHPGRSDWRIHGTRTRLYTAVLNRSPIGLLQLIQASI